MTVRPFRITRRINETHDTFSMDLAAPSGQEPLLFRPGQFNMLYIHGVGEVPISISGDPGKPERVVHTTRAVGTVTTAMGELKKGATIGVRGPYGVPWPTEEAAGRDVVLVAGGIGLAPLRPVIHHLLANRDAHNRIVLLYGTRSPSDILYRRELEQWRSRFDVEVFITVDRGTGDWRGNVGVVTGLIPKAPFDPSECLVMVCGPEVMMRFTAMALEKRGVGDEQIHTSMERNMKCGVGLCGHCQLGPYFVCKDGPVFRFDRIKPWFSRREL